MAKIALDKLASEITKTLRTYTREVEEEVEEVKEEVAKNTVKKLKKTSPKHTGNYAKKWTKKKVGTAQVIYNKEYSLTHLLEKGHITKNKYGTYGRTRAYPHIGSAEKEAIKEFTKKVEKVIKR